VPPGSAPLAAAAPLSGSARLEAFSDAVFAFAATLLVVALEVPATVVELERVLLGFVPFTLSFGALVLLWSVHRGFFRRFPMADRTTVALNSCLLFVVLFYVYPLKFLARGISTMLFGEAVGGGGRIESFEELGKLFAWYGAGFAALFLLVALLYRHGAARAGALGLEAAALREARFLARHYSIFVAVGALSTAMALTGVGLRSAMPGWIYGLLGPLCAAHGAWNGRRERRLAEGHGAPRSR
jgi:uncharacterized membrane protein